ncbi:hypothetical protein B0H13DRAFT_1939830 [Mycena leptocephala]|nr:hypothetical protein B0H13DRAFT_1939830 [Mycena leptocephala]
MGKKEKSRTVAANTELPVVFPDISPKSELECHRRDRCCYLFYSTTGALIHLLSQDIFSPAECKSFVKFIDSLPLELTPPKKRGEAERHNHRYSITSVDFAKRLQTVFAPHLPVFLPSKTGKGSVGPAREAHSFNSNIRVYKYTPNQHFGPHYDDDCRDPMTGAKSEWTLLLYLTGYEDGVEGGETLFYQSGKARLRSHGRECMLHEGSPVVRGVKYVLRSDVMFM